MLLQWDGNASSERLPKQLEDQVSAASVTGSRGSLDMAANGQVMWEAAASNGPIPRPARLIELAVEDDVRRVTTNVEPVRNHPHVSQDVPTVIGDADEGGWEELPFTD